MNIADTKDILTISGGILGAFSFALNYPRFRRDILWKAYIKVDCTSTEHQEEDEHSPRTYETIVIRNLSDRKLVIEYIGYTKRIRPFKYEDPRDWDFDGYDNEPGHIILDPKSQVTRRFREPENIGIPSIYNKIGMKNCKVYISIKFAESNRPVVKRLIAK